jgi:hypothetical protein
MGGILASFVRGAAVFFIIHVTVLSVKFVTLDGLNRQVEQ